MAKSEDTSKEAKQPNTFKRLLNAIDRFQQRHVWLGFPYAVVKKYGDDEAGYEGALMTYYGFLSLFPLLIVATSVIDLISRHNDALREKLLSGVANYFPAISNQLQASVHSTGKTGLALVLGLIVTLFGARGGADALRHALNHIWQVPRVNRPGFPKGPLKSLGLVAGGGLGLLLAAVLSGIATALGHSIWLAALSTLISITLLFVTFTFLMGFGSSSKHSFSDNYIGAFIAAIGFQILQTLGFNLVKNQLHNLQGAYGQFGLVLAILFWIFLLAQVFLYAAEVNTVHILNLWPRSMTQNPPTEADKHAAKLYAKKERYFPKEQENIDIDVDTSDR